MFKLFKNLKTKEWLFIAIGVGFIVGQVYLDLELPTYIGKMTGVISNFFQSGEGSVSQIWGYGGMMLLCAAGSVIASVITGFFAARVAASFSQRLRSKTFNKVNSFGTEEINKFSTASLITRSTNDITQVQSFIAMGLQVLIKAPILAIWAISKITTKSWQWSLATGAAVFLIVAIVTVLVIVALPRFKKVQKLTDGLNLTMRENLTGIRVVRAYNAEEHEQEKFNKANKAVMSNSLFTSRAMAVITPIMTLVMSGLTLAIYVIGAYLINAAPKIDLGFLLGGGSISDTVRGQLLSDTVMFSGWAMQVVMAFMMLTMIFIILPRVTVSAARINEVLDTKPSIVSGNRVDVPVREQSQIEFKKVGFKYPGAAESVLRNINLSINKGETVAFIGGTGSGKSTLINLLPRFYDASDGQVLIDGVNVKDYSQETLHNKLGYIPQSAVIFSGTIESNITFGSNGKGEKSESELLDAMDKAQGAEFVKNREGGLKSAISQSGSNISGGQKQRLAIARAIARKPEIYIFDDSFSALDYKTDKNLRKALKKETKESGATVLIVAQRIGTIRDADKIVVLDDGEVVGVGTHTELMKSCKVYQEIATSQLSKEELA